MVSKKIEGKKHPQYLSPDEGEYAQRFAQNLLNKHKTLVEESSYTLDDISFRLIRRGKPYSRLVTMKAFTPEESKVKGYLYDFELKAPAELLQLGLEAGFGEDNAMGFGCCLEG